MDPQSQAKLDKAMALLNQQMSDMNRQLGNMFISTDVMDPMSFRLNPNFDADAINSYVSGGSTKTPHKTNKTQKPQKKINK